VKGGPLLASATSLMSPSAASADTAPAEAAKDHRCLLRSFILVAQTIVSRQVSPQMPTVLTVGTIHGATKNNIILTK